MPDPVHITSLYTDARRFLTALSQDNTRDWFQDNKDQYDAALKRPAERLLSAIAPRLEHAFDTPVRTKLFRPHRDVRFSTDKTPYHTHLHLMWSLPDGRAWLFGLSPAYATAGAGIMQFEAAQLSRWRDTIADAAGQDLSAMLDQGAWRMDPPALKRVPAPYPADHPRADLLRRKALVVWQDSLDNGLQTDPIATLNTAFDAMAPVQAWLKPVA